MFGEDSAELRPNIFLLRKSCTKYFEQNRGLQENCTGQEKFDMYFCVSSDCYCQSLVSVRETTN